MIGTLSNRFIIVSLLLLTNTPVFAAHILEPIGLEIAATPPRGRMFGEIVYSSTKEQADHEEITGKSLGLEFEVGVGEQTQLHFEAEVVIAEEQGHEPAEKGVEEIAFGVKHRFWDETPKNPDAAFLVEFAPEAGLEGNGSELKTSLLLTKHFSPRFLVHTETGYLHETERESEAVGMPTEIRVHNAGFFIYKIAPVYQVIPDRLLLMATLMGKENLKGDQNDVTLAPGVIFVMGNAALKLSLPFGLSEAANDNGVAFAISKLF
ncbi:MAG: hypothetical protein AAB300_02895 [Nitrospirota bacterium]